MVVAFFLTSRYGWTVSGVFAHAVTALCRSFVSQRRVGCVTPACMRVNDLRRLLARASIQLHIP